MGEPAEPCLFSQNRLLTMELVAQRPGAPSFHVQSILIITPRLLQEKRTGNEVLMLTE